MNGAAYIMERIFKLEDRLENATLDKEEQTIILRAIETYEGQLKTLVRAEEYEAKLRRIMEKENVADA